MMHRRAVLGLAGIGLLSAGAVVYAGQTGRLDLFTPQLPDDADLGPIAGVSHAGVPVRGLTRSAFFNGVSLLNVWASWCPDCRSEHGVLMALAERPGIQLYGLAADDTVQNAARYLNGAGNPYSRLSLDGDRRYQRALKHRGIPQTYVFSPGGNVVERISGAMTPAIVETRLLPAMDKARFSV